MPTESLGGGSCPPIIALLTGHLAESVRVRNASSEHLHALLVDLNAKRRLMCLGLGDKDGKHPPGTGNHHAYGVFGYNSQQRRVTIFNPWGNNFTPKGPPGIANGYPTVNGLFTVPLDEFRQVFTGGSITRPTSPRTNNDPPCGFRRIRCPTSANTASP